MSLFYLIKVDKKECFYLGDGNWAGVFPETENIYPCLSDKFKFNDILPQHRLCKKSYIKFIDGLVRSDGETFSYGNFDTEEILLAAQAWAGDRDIIFSRSFYAEDKYVLTGSANKDDKTGKIHFYIKKLTRLYRWLAKITLLTSIGVYRPFGLNLSRKINRGAR
jgi:hypothetical protein